jgi:DNA-binding CsgD family transcriptional regulator
MSLFTNYFTKSKSGNRRLALFFYALLLAGLVLILKIVEYKYLVRQLHIEIYIGLIAVMFTGLGVWIGLSLIKKKKAIENIDPDIIRSLGLTKREYEVLQLMARGFSNQEIADQLFISLPTVKTHSSNLYTKLDVQRRTQAIRKAKELQLIA